MIDYLTEKEVKCLNDNQKKIYDGFGKKAALGKYNQLCVLEYVCPICGSDLSNDYFCNKCNSQFSIIGKKLND